MESTSEPIQETPAPPPEDQRAARLQFPRRVVLQLIAFVLACLIIFGLRFWLANAFPLSGGGGRGLELVFERLPASLSLLVLALFLALVQALILTAIAVGIHRLESRAGLLGSVLKGLGRLWLFSQAALPAFALAILAIYVFALQLDIVPPIWAAAQRAGLLERALFYILAALCLALLPATLAAQVMAREVTLPREQAAPRLWLGALLKGLAALFGQISGWLSALVLVEVVFDWPGIGGLFMDGLNFFDLGAITGALLTYALLALAGKLLAELFHWIERLMRVPPPGDPLAGAAPWRRTARRVWVILSLVLLIAPAGLCLAGLITGREAAVEQSLAEANDPPSGAHWLGADGLGRDVGARVARGGLRAVTLALASGLIASILGGATGLVTGRLAARRTFKSESLADLLLIPTDAMLFIPAVPVAVFLSLGFGLGSSIGLIAALALAVAPRLARYFHALWAARVHPDAGNRLLPALGSLVLAGAFAALLLLASIDFLGFGGRPPQPGLGETVREAVNNLGRQAFPLFGATAALWLCAFPLYNAAAALLGYFPTREPLARLNE